MLCLATHPQLYDGNPDTEMVEGARKLMQLYAAFGCKPTWTCAPYQIPGGPKFGEHIVVGESNAVTYYNSAIGARTNKYGDYLDVACALIGKAPYAGLHTDEGRQAELYFDVSQLPEQWRAGKHVPPSARPSHRSHRRPTRARGHRAVAIDQHR